MTDNLMNAPETLLPEDPAAAELEVKADISHIVVRHPASALAWAILSEEAMVADHRVLAYAFARTGYHRSLDALRKNGWKGAGPVPWSHKPNRGFSALRRGIVAGSRGDWVKPTSRCGARSCCVIAARRRRIRSASKETAR